MSVLDRLRNAVGAEHVVTDPDLTGAYGTDWTGRWSAQPLAVVRPASTAEVSALVQICAADRIPLVPQGGNTGLVGGSVPARPDAVVLSLRRLTSHSEVDVDGRRVTVGAGLTVAQVHALAAASGLTYGVDLASRDSATIGGTIATNAGGIRVVRFGDTRAQIVGVEVVLVDGSVVDRTGALPKDSAGYDLTQLMVGSEGTLAVLTAARLRLHEPLPSGRVTTMVGVSSVAEAVSYIRSAVTSRTELLAAEYIDDDGMRLVRDLTGLPHPVAGRWPFYLLIETAEMPHLPDGADAAVDPRLWVYRERQSEAASTLGTGHHLDVALPLHELDGFLAGLPELVAPHRVFTFGHLAEGNVHIQIHGPVPEDQTPSETVLRIVARLGGSISSEHGVGRAKAAYLPLSRARAELDAMRAIKAAFDPGRLLNPGVLLDAETSADGTMSGP